MNELDFDTPRFTIKKPAVRHDQQGDAPDAERAARAIDAFMRDMTRSAATYMESCIHCGHCAEACHFYVTSGDPQYTPIWKLEPFKQAYKREAGPFAWFFRTFSLKKAVTAEKLRQWQELLYDSCTMCGRCTLACPMGIDIASLVRRAREGMAAGGFAPPDLYKAAERALDTGSPIGVRWPALKRQIELQEQETGLRVPIDVEGAEYLVVLTSIEIMGFPEIIGALARIFRQAGATWTIPSAGFEATNVGVQMGSREVAAALLQRIVDAAERLKVL